MIEELREVEERIQSHEERGGDRMKSEERGWRGGRREDGIG